MASLKPGKIWEIKHVIAPKFHVSGPPRDIVGIYDKRYIDNPYQLKTIERLEERDAKKAFGDKNFVYKVDDMFPEKPTMPNNQKAAWYERKAQDAYAIHDSGAAYWFYLVASEKVKGDYMRKRRLAQAADSHLKVWRTKNGYC